MPEHAPKFVREFSREKSAEKRSAVATKIRAERGEYFQGKKEQAEVEKQIQDLENRLDEYNSDSFANKIKDYFKVRATRESLGVAQARKTELDDSAASRDPRKSGQDAIEAFYEAEKKKWADSEYSKEDISRYFTEEHLASLPIEDYALLMKRFPSEMVTHVTRQGVRDHVGMVFHSVGEDVMHRGFEKMLEDDRRLRSPLAVRLAEGVKDDAIINAITPVTMGGVQPPQSREQALQYLTSKVDKYDDSASVHFAAEEVADHYYGSEKGNEIFVAYPSAFIVSQYYSGHTDAAMPSGDKMMNDVWVRDREEKGMNLDAALTFIPKSAQVDPHNGSRYEIGEDGRPVKNEPAYRSLEMLASHPELSLLAEQTAQIMRRVSEELPPPSTWERELEGTAWSGYPYKDALRALLPIRDRLKEISGIEDDRILKSIIDFRAAGYVKADIGDLARKSMQRAESNTKAGVDETINEILESAGARFLEAQNTVSSEEYWQKYFSEHPERRPSKLVFYEGEDPSRAFMRWKAQMGLTKKSKEANMGFGERRFTDTQGARFGSDRFESMVRKVIDERFPETEEPPTSEETQDGPADDSELPPPLPIEDQARQAAP